MTRKRQAKAGYTLVEMLVVLALLGMATAISLPYATSSGQVQRLEASASQLATLFRHARTLAYVTNKEVKVSFERDSRKWRVNGSTPQLQLDPSLTVIAMTIEGEVNEKEIGYRFFPAGGSSGGRVVLAENENRVGIDLNWLTGTVTWKRLGDKL
jgi:general secretion pathway protein H